MAERGKARAALVSTGSNSRVASGGGTLYRVLVSPTTYGATVRIDDSLDLGANPDLNATGANTIGTFGTLGSDGLVILDFAPGVGFNSGLAIAATSNARLTVIYEP